MYARLPEEGKEHVLHTGASLEIGPGISVGIDLVREVDEDGAKGPTEVEAGAGVAMFEINDEIFGDEKGAESVGVTGGLGGGVGIGAFLSLKTSHAFNLAYPQHEADLALR